MSGPRGSSPGAGSGARLLEAAIARLEELGEATDYRMSFALGSPAMAALGQRDYRRAASVAAESVARAEARGDARIAGLDRIYRAVTMRELGDLIGAIQLVALLLTGGRARLRQMPMPACIPLGTRRHAR